MGISFSEFMELVDKHEIEVSYRGGNKLLVNDDTLDSYILKYGGRKERYADFIAAETEFTQDKAILKYGDVILSTCILERKRCFLESSRKWDYSKITMDNFILTRNWNYSTATTNDFNLNGFNGNQILDAYKIIYLKKENLKMLKRLYSYGLTDEILAKYYKDEFYDLRIHKNSVEGIVIKEKIGNVTFTLTSFIDFFKTYNSNLAQYKKINFLKSSKKNDIIKKANEKFGY